MIDNICRWHYEDDSVWYRAYASVFTDWVGGSEWVPVCQECLTNFIRIHEE